MASTGSRGFLAAGADDEEEEDVLVVVVVVRGDEAGIGALGGEADDDMGMRCSADGVMDLPPSVARDEALGRPGGLLVLGNREKAPCWGGGGVDMSSGI
jgi:hypothetical protein